MEYWLTINIKDINEYYIIKVQIVKKLELEFIWGFTVLLTIATVFS